MLNRLAQSVMVFALLAAFLPFGVEAAMPASCPMVGSASVDVGGAGCEHCPLPVSNPGEQPSPNAPDQPGVMSCCCVVAVFFVDTGTADLLPHILANEFVVPFDRTADDFKVQPPSPPPRPVP